MCKKIENGFASILICATVVGMGFGLPCFGQATYSVVDLGTLGGLTSETRNLNSAGKVVGLSDVSSGTDQHAFFWDGVVMTDLGTLGGRDSNARDVSDADVIVGRADFNYWFQHAFRWENGVKTDLGTLGGLESSAYEINANGQIVGWADLSNGASHAFLWENGVMTDLGTLGGVSSEAHGLNSLGDVVGFSKVNGGSTRAFFYSNNSMTELGTLGGPKSWAYAVNDNGEVVGESHTSSGPSHACLWQNGNPVDLGTLGGNKSMAWDINSQGQIVGMSENVDGVNRGFIYDNGMMLSLNDLISQTSSWNIKEARGINDSGEIVARGKLNGGDDHAVLLIPDGGSAYVLSGPVPGIAGQRNSFTANGGTPGSRSTFMYGLGAGSSSVPGCADITLSLKNAKKMGTATADGSGVAILSIPIPGSARGVKVLFQTYEGDTCRITNVVTHTFQ